MMPMDFANALRGDYLFLDFLTQPAFAHDLMQFCVDAVNWYYPKLLTWCDELQDGHRFGFGGTWAGPNVLGFTTNDAAVLCGPDIYDEFGYPYEQQLLSSYEGCLYHIHNHRMQYAPKLVQLEKLSLLQISHDPKTPHPLEDLARILPLTGDANLLFDAPADLWRKHLDELTGRNVICHVHCRGCDEAKEMIQFIRRGSKPLST